jgi:hypothetical protein
MEGQAVFILALILIGAGIAVLALGSRLAVLAAGVGMLLGVGLIHLLPGAQDSGVWLIGPVALAIVFGLGVGFMKGLVNLIILSIGVLAGAAVALALLDLFGLNGGLPG